MLYTSQNRKNLLGVNNLNDALKYNNDDCQDVTEQLLLDLIQLIPPANLIDIFDSNST